MLCENGENDCRYLENLIMMTQSHYPQFPWRAKMCLIDISVFNAILANTVRLNAL